MNIKMAYFPKLIVFVTLCKNVFGKKINDGSALARTNE